MMLKKPHNGNGPRQTYYVHKQLKAPHKTMFKASPSPLTYQFAHKTQMNHSGKPISVNLLSNLMLTQHLCTFDPKPGGSYKIR